MEETVEKQEQVDRGNNENMDMQQLLKSHQSSPSPQQQQLTQSLQQSPKIQNQQQHQKNIRPRTWPGINKPGGVAHIEQETRYQRQSCIIHGRFTVLFSIALLHLVFPTLSSSFFFVYSFPRRPLSVAFSQPFPSDNGNSGSSSNNNSNNNNNNEQNRKPSIFRGRRERKIQERRRDYERRRDLWVEKYGSFEALSSTFGTARGDLTKEETRRLYHTLLPRSLLGLYEMGLMKPDELAPLAYEARIAAKEYARSRCVWTGRIATTVFDQYRSLKDYGQLGKSSSMSWKEIWNKYEAQIVQEECVEALESNNKNQTQHRQSEKQQRKGRRSKLLDGDETLTMRIYLRILERSCTTNQVFDQLFLKQDDGGDEDDLAEISSKLEDDVRLILLRPNERAKVERKIQKDKKQLEREIKKRKKMVGKIKKGKKKKETQKTRSEKAKNKEKHSETIPLVTDVGNYKTYPPTKRVEILRILAGTRRKLRHFQGKLNKPTR